MKNVKKSVILLATVAVTALTFVAIGQMISGDVQLSKGIIFTLVGVVLLSWVITSFSKHRITYTRIYLILLFSGLFVLISSAYLDINSSTDVRNSIVGAFTTEKGKFRESVDLVVQRVELKFVEIEETPPSTPEKEIEEPVKDAEIGNGTKAEEPEKKVAATKHILIGGGILIGADGHYITLHNSPGAVNPSWPELKTFLLNDQTDGRRYDFDTFVCADFAEELHNNAEKVGIRAAFVGVKLGPCSYFPSMGGHALNAFETTDQGLVFIDCTSSNQGVNSDKIVKVQVGQDYIPRSIFPEPGWSAVWGNMGEVIEIEVIEW